MATACDNTLYDDSLLFPSKFFAEFDHDPRSSSSALVSGEDLQQQQRSTGTESRISFLETAAVTSAGVSSESGHIMQGRVESYPASHHVPTVHDPFGRGLWGDYGSISFNELSDVWGDLRPYPQELSTPAVLPSQKLGWNEVSASCSPTEDPLSTTISVELHKPSVQRGSSSCPITTSAETLALERIDLEFPRPFQPESNHMTWPVEISLTSVAFDSSLVHHGSSRSLVSKDSSLRHDKSDDQPEILEGILSALSQSEDCQKSGLRSQSLMRDRVQDVTVDDALHDFKVTLGSRQHNFLQQGPSVAMRISPDVHRRHQPGECNIRCKAHQFKSKNLRDTPKVMQFAPRKYQRRRILHGNDIKDKVTSVPMPLDHVQRERQRRDLMTSKIAVLELLLPKSSKRDRVSVVYDAIELLRRLERQVKDLQKKHDTNRLPSASLAPSARHRQSLDPGKVSVPMSTDCNMKMSARRFSNEVVIKRSGTYMKPVDVLTRPTWGTSCPSRQTKQFSKVSSVRCLGEQKIQEREDVFVEFHVHLDNNVRVQQEKLLKCRCRQDYLSTIMGLVNEFQLDVSNLNIVKLSGYFICVMGLKTSTGKEMTTAALFAARLKSAVFVDVAREAEMIPSIGGQNCPIT